MISDALFSVTGLLDQSMIADHDRLSLILRTLQVDETCWHQFETEFAKRCPAGNESRDHRLLALEKAWKSMDSHVVSLDEPVNPPNGCPCCKTGSVAVSAIKPNDLGTPLVYFVCASCDLGFLLRDDVADLYAYTSPDYYMRRDTGGAGYESYLADSSYRVAKGLRLLDWIRESTESSPRTLLEVGSAFGFTRAAAEGIGIRTFGIDLNPNAVVAAEKLYSQQTFAGTLEQAITQEKVELASYDIVLYQFVLEHVEKPAEELKLAARMLAPDGILVLTVPNMRSHERQIFGASYRSFRSDHFWLFSPASITILLADAGLRPTNMKSECNIRILSGFLSQSDLDSLDADCWSADLLVIAKRR